MRKMINSCSICVEVRDVSNQNESHECCCRKQIEMKVDIDNLKYWFRRMTERLDALEAMMEHKRRNEEYVEILHDAIRGRLGDGQA